MGGNHGEARVLKLVIETPIWRDGGAVGVAARRLVDGTMGGDEKELSERKEEQE